VLTPNLFADIVPGVGAAGFSLGQSITEFDEVLASASRWDKTLLQIGQAINAVDGWLLVEDSQLRSPGLERLYQNTDFLTGRSLHFGSGAVKIHFNGDGVIDCIEISEGYKGLLHGALGIGDELKLALQYFELEYDDVEEMHHPLDAESSRLISFYAEEKSLLSSPNQRIHSVFISAP
jgi:hypothetical protein